MGELTWVSDFEKYEYQMGYRDSVAGKSKPKNSKPQNKPNDKRDKPNVLFCKEFQTGMCSESGSIHKGTFRGQSKTLWHICATCFLDDRIKKFHAEVMRDAPTLNLIDGLGV